MVLEGNRGYVVIDIHIFLNRNCHDLVSFYRKRYYGMVNLLQLLITSYCERIKARYPTKPQLHLRPLLCSESYQ